MGEISVRLTPDEDGYLGRECPECERYFKVTPGTGLTGTSHCICPYCGKNEDTSRFLTRDQVAYAKSVALQQVSAQLHGQLKQLERDVRPSGPFGIGISIKVEGGTEIPIAGYEEKKLETEIVCESGGHRYAVYGVSRSVRTAAYGTPCKSSNGVSRSRKRSWASQPTARTRRTG